MCSLPCSHSPPDGLTQLVCSLLMLVVTSFIESLSLVVEVGLNTRISAGGRKSRNNLTMMPNNFSVIVPVVAFFSLRRRRLRVLKVSRSHKNSSSTSVEHEKRDIGKQRDFDSVLIFLLFSIFPHPRELLFASVLRNKYT